MRVSKATQTQIEEALQRVNKEYDGNVIFNNFSQANAKRTIWNVTLKVIDSHGKGARLGFPDYRTGKQRHLINACWHVHGTFFDALLDIVPDAEIRAAGNAYIYRDQAGNVHGNWQDRNIGSVMNPLHFSDACECS